MAIKNNYLVEKRNVLNELRSNNMTLQELRFFSIYLSKINARDINTRLVRFPLDDFQKIMDLDRPKISYLKNVVNSLLCKIVNVPAPYGGFIAFQLFKECTVTQDELGEWYVEIDAHDKALPLMFEFKEKYFSYQLWNALKLKSANQLRMFEILKQYEKAGERIISVDELKELLGISKDEYIRWDNFKTCVLEVCRKALEENTDIKFTYEPYGKRGKGNKILNIKFKIYKNKNYSDPLTLEQFIGKTELFDNDDLEGEVIENEYQKRFKFLQDACKNEFNENEFEIIYNLVMQVMPEAISQKGLDLDQYHYIMQKYSELNLQASKKTIKSRFRYFKKLIEIDLA